MSGFKEVCCPGPSTSTAFDMREANKQEEEADDISKNIMSRGDEEQKREDKTKTIKEEDRRRTMGQIYFRKCPCQLSLPLYYNYEMLSVPSWQCLVSIQARTR